MGELKLYGMKAAFDEIMGDRPSSASTNPSALSAICSTPRSTRSKARSIKYQLTIAKLPLAKDLDDFQFEGTPINPDAGQRPGRRAGSSPSNANVVLVGGTGTGKTHMAISHRQKAASGPVPAVAFYKRSRTSVNRP